MEIFFTNLRANELHLLKNSEDRENFQRSCKRVQLKLVTFQIRMVQELLPCLRNETLIEYEAYIKITNKLGSYVCNLDERRLKVLGKIENYDLVMFRGGRLLNCARNSTNVSKFDLTREFCTFSDVKLFDCSSKLFGGADNVEPRTLVKTVWKFLRLVIECEKKTKIDAKYVFNYLSNLLIPTIQIVLRDNNQLALSASTEEI
jgi:hypothetical protein